MKNYKMMLGLMLGLGLAITTSVAQTAADNYVTQGRAYLAAQDLVDANARFNAAVTASETNETANALLAATRLLVLPQQTAGSNFLNGLGIPASGRNLFNWTAMLPKDANGNTIDPSENSSVAVAFIQNTVIPALSASATNLSRVTDPGYTLTLTAAETSGNTVTVDYGDILLMQAGVYAGEFLGYTLNAQNFNVVARTLQTQDAAGGLSIQQVLAEYPSLLAPNSGAALASSKAALTNAIQFYQQASAFIRNVRQPGQGLFMLTSDELAKEAEFRSDLTNILLSLNGPVTINPQQPIALNLGNYFAGAKSLRSLVPQFNGDNYVNNTLPDYTFGGILQGEPAYVTEGSLRQKFGKHDYSGIYTGQVYANYNYSPATNFAAFVSTSQQVTIIGFDPDSQSAIYKQFSLDKSGNAEITNSAYTAYASFYNGSCYVEVDFTNGATFSLNGNELPPLGAFQTAAGFYNGTISGGGNDPYLDAILAPDGEVFFCPTSSSGIADDAGAAQLGGNNQFTATSINDTQVAGTLNPRSLVINGTYQSGGQSGTWTLHRSGNVPFDLPPVLTSVPANAVAMAGDSAKFAVSATGSAPLCYQWYFNDTSIPGATASALVVSNLQAGDAGRYSVAVNNVAGGTNAYASLTVTPETNQPTVKIINMPAGLRVSNAVFTVMGTASDKVAVTGVSYSLNNSPDWLSASPQGTNFGNWTAPVTLNPGLNSVQVQAVNPGGIYSTLVTNYVTYVVSAVLTVQTNRPGWGTISPNYNGASLPIGSSYTVTATAAAGFKFLNWSNNFGLVTNPATLNFKMQTNLVLTANFADTTPPTFSFTAPTAGQRVGSGIFTVAGKSGDNAAVSNVWLQLNHAGWFAPTGLTNWTVAVALTPGTNILQGYAVDTSGNHGTTNNLAFDYVVTNQLVVQFNGLGTLSPNYSNAWLELGRNYSLTAMPATGFAFTNWGVTNGSGSISWSTNKPTVQLMMASNLTLTASLVEVTRPTVTIVTPKAGQRVNGAGLAVTGTTTDNWQVTNVWLAVGTNGWLPAGSTNHYKNWVGIGLWLTPGTNVIRVYAVNLGGNNSLTNSVQVLATNLLVLPTIKTPSVVMAGPAVAVTGTRMTAEGLAFQLHISGAASGVIEVSTNLTDWTTVTNFAGTNTTINFVDPGATNASQRFYRTVVP